MIVQSLFRLSGIGECALSLVSFNGCMTFRTSDKKTVRYFQKRGVDVRISWQHHNGNPVRIVETGASAFDAHVPCIVFIHGAPGSSNNFYRYQADADLVQRTRLLSVDRLGYGYSNYGRSEPSLAEQAASIRTVLEAYQPCKAILVGHSYGGPIVAKAALDYPDLVEALVMLSPVNDPESEKVFWFAHLARWEATRWLLSGAWRVSGDEKFGHEEELRKMEDQWPRMRVPVVHIHGQLDSIAPPANIEFSRKNIPEALLEIIVLPWSGHFIPWTNYRLIRQKLVELLPRSANSKTEPFQSARTKIEPN